ncbi:MAG: caspase family protein [Spirochaetaceae bacterium]|nr:caspase family protein [Spirochaetaceae bacterium]
MKKSRLVFWGFVVFALQAVSVAAQQKYALVIGNGAYKNLSRLNNPANDARDINSALKELGFTVDTVIDGSRVQMEEAVERFKNRLSVSKNSYGFLFYAGHGVQSGSVNYLIPVDADIRSESYLRDRAVSVQAILDEINNAGNELNIVVLDACRDNPFSWGRSGSRGLQVVGNQPADSIIVYATAAGATAADGTGRNGVFTGQLLKNLQTPGLDVNEIFRLTGGDVARVSGGSQRPAVYNQFYGIAYLGNRPQTATAASPAQPAPAPVQPAVVPQRPAQTAWASSDTDMTGYWNGNDVDIVCKDIINSLLESPSIVQLTAQNKRLPVILVGDFKNEGSEFIDTGIVSERMKVAILNNGKAEFVAVPAGTDTGADFMLTGSVRTIISTSGNQTVREYYVRAEFTDINTYRIIWMGENSKIKKAVTNKRQSGSGY